MKISVKRVTIFALVGVVVLIIFSIIYNNVEISREYESSSFNTGKVSLEGLPSNTGLRSPSLLSLSKQNPFDSIDSKVADSAKPVNNNIENSFIREGSLTQKKIIKNGQLTLFVKNIENSATEIQNITQGVDGYVQNSSINKGQNKELKNAVITIRVPAKNFENSVSKIKEIAEDVEREDVSVADVGEKYIDLQGQLKNLEAEEVQYQKIMSQAVTINDILQVSQKLSSVRGQIESIKGQIQYLDRQIDMSTITVYLNSESEVRIMGIKWKPLLNIKRTARSMLSGVTVFLDFIVKLIIYIPLILLIGGFVLLVIFGFRRLYYWLKKKFWNNGIF